MMSKIPKFLVFLFLVLFVAGPCLAAKDDIVLGYFPYAVDSAGLLIRDAAGLNFVANAPATAGEDITAVHAMADGRVVCGSESGTVRMFANDGSMHLSEIAYVENLPEIAAIDSMSDLSIVVACVDGSVYKYQYNGSDMVEAASVVLNEDIVDMVVQSSDHVIIGGATTGPHLRRLASDLNSVATAVIPNDSADTVALALLSNDDVVNARTNGHTRILTADLGTRIGFYNFSGMKMVDVAVQSNDNVVLVAHRESDDYTVIRVRANLLADHIAFRGFSGIPGTAGVLSNDNIVVALTTNPIRILSPDAQENVLVKSYLTGTVKDLDVMTSPIEIIDPNLVDGLAGGTTTEIQWQAADVVSDYVKVEFSRDNGLYWSTVETSVPNTGSYMWVVPKILTTEGLIRISDANASYMSDTSDTAFEIYMSDFPDLTGDKLVDIEDLIILAGDWLKRVD